MWRNVGLAFLARGEIVDGMDIDHGALLGATMQPENLRHAILYGLSGVEENSIITEHHLPRCSQCQALNTPVEALRALALDLEAEQILLEMPHPVVALAYAVTEPYVEWDPEDPFRYGPAEEHPHAIIATTTWCYSIDGVSYASRTVPGASTTALPVGMVDDDRVLTALRTLVLRLKCALRAG